MTSEIIILEIQPTAIAGKIVGLKVFMANVLTGIGLGIIGILWTVVREGVFFVNAFLNEKFGQLN